jgi:hypothetical protein
VAYLDFEMMLTSDIRDAEVACKPAPHCARAALGEPQGNRPAERAVMAMQRLQ